MGTAWGLFWAQFGQPKKGPSGAKSQKKTWPQLPTQPGPICGPRGTLLELQKAICQLSNGKPLGGNAIPANGLQTRGSKTPKQLNCISLFSSCGNKGHFHISKSSSLSISIREKGTISPVFLSRNSEGMSVGGFMLY